MTVGGGGQQDEVHKRLPTTIAVSCSLCQCALLPGPVAGALRLGNVTVYPLSTMPLFSLRRVVTLWAILGTPAATGQTDSFRIQDGRVGKLHVGMTVEEFYSAFSGQVLRLTNLDLEGMFSPALEARSNGRVLLIGEIDKTPNGWIIFRLTLKDRRFHTSKGISVGSMFADLKRAYPDLRLLMGEGQQFAFIEAESLSFGLDAYPEAPSNRSKVTSVLMLR
jgi:hypothetical protein